MAFVADYIGAIVVEAANYGYPKGARNNRPKAWCLHTPEEVADSEPSTPYYFHNTTRNASTTYFVSYLGFVFQCVPESEGAYANAVEGKPYPAWADSSVNLNLQTLSIEIEGYAATIHQTMPRGSSQWRALVRLMANRCDVRSIPPGHTFAHKDVSIYRSDPGQLNIPVLVADVIAAMEGDDMPTQAEFDALKRTVDILVDQVNQWLLPHLSAVAPHLSLQQIEENIAIKEGHLEVTQGLVDQIAALLPKAVPVLGHDHPLTLTGRTGKS